MGFGLFKKLKDSMNKARAWLAKVLPPARKIFAEARPVVKTFIDSTTPKLPPQWQSTMKKASEIYDTAQKGIEAADDAINRDDFSGIKDWTNANITPRLKASFQ